MITSVHTESGVRNIGALRLPTLMVERGLVRQSDLAVAEAHSVRAQIDLVDALVALEFVSERDGYTALANVAGTELIALGEVASSELAVRLVPERLARRHLVVPLSVDNRTLTYATCRPFAVDAENDLRFASGRRTALVVATRTEVISALDRYYARSQTADTPPQPVRSAPVAQVPPPASGTAASPVIDRCNQIIARALSAGASDIQIDCGVDGGTIHHCVAGMLQPVVKLPAAVANPIRDQFKTMARIGVAIRNRPQEGTFRLTVNGRPTDVRLSTEPIAGGERLALRVIDSQGPLQNLSTLGYDETTLAGLKDALASSKGLVLVTGPSGSGITTTLYAALAEVQKNRRDIVTIEDPIERTVPGITQIPVNAKAGNTIPSVLRSMLLGDPKVIMVDEIRDDEVARIASQAARNGHLVLTSIKAVDAAAAIARLTDLVIDPVKVADCLTAVIAQRLLRTVCPNCRIQHDDVDARRRGARYSAQKIAASAGTGCAQCKYTGYGRQVTIAERLTVSDAVRDAIARRATPQEIRAALSKAESLTLRDRALALVARGVTSIQEVERVLGADVHRKPAPARQSLRVLVTDDEPVTRMLVTRLLQREHFDVLEAATGQQALDMALRERPDLLLIDLNMPELDGYEAIGRLRADAQTATLPIVVLTADDNPGVERRVLELGADDYIVKPFDPGTLVSRVKAVFRRMRVMAA